MPGLQVADNGSNPYQAGTIPMPNSGSITQPTNGPVDANGNPYQAMAGGVQASPFQYQSSGTQAQNQMSNYYNQTNGAFAQRQQTFNGLTSDADRIAYLKQNPDLQNSLAAQYGPQSGYGNWNTQADYATRSGQYDASTNTNYDVAGAPQRSWQASLNPAITQGQVAAAQAYNGVTPGYTGATGAINQADPINTAQNSQAAQGVGPVGGATWNQTSQQNAYNPSATTPQPQATTPNAPVTSDPTPKAAAPAPSNPYTQQLPNYYQPTQGAQNNVYGQAASGQANPYDTGGASTSNASTAGAYKIDPNYMKGWQ